MLAHGLILLSLAVTDEHPPVLGALDLDGLKILERNAARAIPHLLPYNIIQVPHWQRLASCF